MMKRCSIVAFCLLAARDTVSLVRQIRRFIRLLDAPKLSLVGHFTNLI